MLPSLYLFAYYIPVLSYLFLESIVQLDFESISGISLAANIIHIIYYLNKYLYKFPPEWRKKKNRKLIPESIREKIAELVEKARPWEKKVPVAGN